VLPSQAVSPGARCEEAGSMTSDPEPTRLQGSGKGAWISFTSKLKEGNDLLRLPIHDARGEAVDAGSPPRPSAGG